MIVLLNFSHPIRPSQLERLAELCGEPIKQTIDVESQVDLDAPLTPQVVAMADRCGLLPVDWQTEPILVVLPSLNFSAAALLSEMHGRMGHFPTIVRMRPVSNGIATVYEVAELVNLQAVRDEARQRRSA